eukprot:GFKZ01014247.1.p1 GENE.GFKZ01014247.1~~GFKZ01014247.1.p1  ORF type:complete len:634 (+),score=57.27 GFKZ01014247.1:285-2186(+)
MREQWSSRIAFIVASVGAAIGFGNVWRFPTLAFTFGGGAFFIPYLLALFVIGIPVLILEVTVGQYYQTGDAGAFGRVNKRFRGIGLASVFCSFVVTLYYCQLIVWALRMFVYSIQGSDGRWRGVSGEEAVAWFQNVVTGLGTAENSRPTRLVGPNVGALAIVWVVIFLCLAFGVKWTGRIAFVTVGLPVLFLFVLLIRAVTLEGAGDGVREYIGRWDTSVLRTRPEVWSEAVTQVFFSLSVTFGVMTAYASYNPRNEPVFFNSVVIAIANSLYSIIAGFAVYGTVGYIAQLQDVEVTDLRREDLGGPALVFSTYPLALSTLPGHGHWERLLFVVLFLLGIDSAFALTEAVITVLSDSALLRNVRRVFVVAGVCLVSFLLGLVYTTDTGLLFLDVTDFYVNFMMLLVGLFETFAIGWIYGIEDQMKVLGTLPVAGFVLATFAPIVLASGFWFGLENRAIMWGFISLGIGYAVLMGLVLVLLARKVSSDQSLTWRTALKELLMGNVLKFRRDVTGIVRYIPLVWFILIRHFIPQILLILFANLASAKTDLRKSKFGNYSDYSAGYQALGITVFSISLGLLLLGVVFPRAYACFDVNHVENGDVANAQEQKHGLRKEKETGVEKVPAPDAGLAAEV